MDLALETDEATPADVPAAHRRLRELGSRRAALSLQSFGGSRVLWQIILPNSKPALAALAIFTFTASWNSFLWPLVVVNKPDSMTIQVGLSSMKGEIIPWGVLMAGTFISAVPLAVLYILLQKVFVQGIVTSGIKG